MDGSVLADDILDLIREAGKARPKLPAGRGFLGNHDSELQPRGGRKKLSPILVDALDETARQLNGHGIFRNPADHGFASAPYSTSSEWRAVQEKRRRWEAETLPNRTPPPHPK